MRRSPSTSASSRRSRAAPRRSGATCSARRPSVECAGRRGATARSSATRSSIRVFSSFRTAAELWLEDLFVVPERARLGRRPRAARRGRATGARAGRGGRRDWDVLDWNAAAIGFYERAGRAAPMADWLTYGWMRGARALAVRVGSAAPGTRAADAEAPRGAPPAPRGAAPPSIRVDAPRHRRRARSSRANSALATWPSRPSSA